MKQKQGPNVDRMWCGVQEWMIALNDYPGWKDWVAHRVGLTLYFDDPSPPENPQDEFKLPPRLELEHAVIVQYLGLLQTITTLKECEFYFRRYPFRGLPVTRANHITNVCEMYFGRFYEFKERLKKYFSAVKRAAPHHGLDFGKFIRLYEKIFDHELRARHGVHHHRRFEDIAIERVSLTDSLSSTRSDWGFEQGHQIAYRKVVKEWVQRVRARGAKMDEVLETISEATLTSCPFLRSR